MSNLLAIFIGAGAGGVLRHFMVGGVARLAGTAFPCGTLAVNVAGAFILGLLVSFWALHAQPSPLVRNFAVTGLLGGFTTFSAFTLETVTLLGRQQTGAAIAYIAASVAGSVLAMALGFWLARQVS